MKRAIFLFAILLGVSSFIFSPKSVFAETCPCYCNTPSGIESAGKVDVSVCGQTCLDKGATSMASCVPEKATTTSAEPEPTSSVSTSTGTTPPPANGACDCWCSSTSGANKLPNKMISSACDASCKKSGGHMVACATKVDQTPERSPYCFTPDLCTKQNGVLKVSPDCISSQGYCFPDPAKAAKATLNVAIGDYKVSGDVGEYVNTLIQWLLGVGIVVVIVFVMIGGLQYTLGAGAPDMIGKGKKRITQAITGLVLLLSCYLILQTVNPYLLRMKVPAYPMVKRVDLVVATSCEKMEAEYVIKGMDDATIPAEKKKCGTSAKIVSKKDGGEVSGATTCDYKKCSNEGEGCLGSGATAKCLKCSAVVPGLAGVTPSKETCSSLQLDNIMTSVDGKAMTKTANYCFYTHDPTVIVGTVESFAFVAKTGLAAAVTGGFGGAVAATYFGKDLAAKMYTGACAESHIDCNKIRSQSTTNDQCKAYDTIATAFSDLTGGAGGSPSSMENFFLSDKWGDFNLQKLCLANPCGVPGGCMMDSGVTGLGTDCIQSTIGDLSLKGPQTTCPGGCSGGKKCFTDGTTAACATCEEMTKENKVGGKGIVPSQVVCNQGSSVKDVDFCGFTTDSDANGPACAHVALDCAKVKTLGNKACDYYRDVEVGNGSDQDWLGVFRQVDGNFGLDYICQKDPCGAAAIEGKSACTFTSNATVADNCE